MRIRNIAMELSGKLEKDKISRLYFMEILEDIYNIRLDKIMFWWKQSNDNEEQFYYLVFDFLNTKAQKNENDNNKFNRLLCLLSE